VAWADRFYRWSCGLNRAGIAVVLAMMVATTVLVLAEILLRNLFSTSTHMMAELVGYGVAAMTFLSLGYCFEHGVLIRMGMLLGPLGRFPTARRTVEVILTIAAIATNLIVMRYFLLSLIRNYTRGYVSETTAQIPLWIPEFFVAVGLAILLVHLVAYLFVLVFNTSAPIRDM